MQQGPQDPEAGDAPDAAEEAREDRRQEEEDRQGQVRRRRVPEAAGRQAEGAEGEAEREPGQEEVPSLRRLQALRCSLDSFLPTTAPLLFLLCSVEVCRHSVK